jgi:hypothetical protein
MDMFVLEELQQVLLIQVVLQQLACAYDGLQACEKRMFAAQCTCKVVAPALRNAPLWVGCITQCVGQVGPA